MGVTGLWHILQPCARPIKIETLNRKRLAVDASIWIYQFLKAVRDKEGNALRNSHVVGFFRRICKLLFFGIKPVFVFDGGAPALKRQTIRARKSRREGRREDAVRTAGKLLAVQMQRRAEEEEAQRRAERERGPEAEEVVPEDGLVYVDELQMTTQERQQNRTFRKKDQYHLPDLNVSIHDMGGPDDPRVMSLEELQTYARQFDTGEDINVYDFSKIDYDSPFFTSLPASDRYNILNAARLRSRLRMGHSKEQLDSMFPDRMAFSKFQIERVRERNELTQRLMHLNGFEDAVFGGGRVAGEKGREYVLVRNEGVEGGWALGVISEEGKEDKPIELDKPATASKTGQDDESDNDEFEDVPIAGLNRLPTKRTQTEVIADKLMQQRRAVYTSRRRPVKPRKVGQKNTQAQNSSSLFVQSSDDEDHDWEEVNDQHDFVDDNGAENSEDEELRKAIALSLQKENADTVIDSPKSSPSSDEDDMLEVFQQRAAEEQAPLPKGSGRAIANIVNRRAFEAAPESREITSFGVPTQKPEESDDESMDLQAALAESRRSKRKTNPPRRRVLTSPPADTARDVARKAGFKGPLPFEKLDLGTSLLGKKKMQERTEAAAGGFENPELVAKEQKTGAEPLPPWFSSNLDEDMEAQRAAEARDRQKVRGFEDQFEFQNRHDTTLRRDDTLEIIDLEAESPDRGTDGGEVIDLNDEAGDEIEEQLTLSHKDPSPLPGEAKVGDLAGEIRAEPSIGLSEGGNFMQVPQYRQASPSGSDHSQAQQNAVGEEENLEWSESEPDVSGKAQHDNLAGDLLPAKDLKSTGDQAGQALKSPSASAESEDLEFEEVDISRPPISEATNETTMVDESGVARTSGLIPQDTIAEEDEDFDDFSDPEDAEILRALTLEAEEHARFASTLNNKSQAQNIIDYEKELKQLRLQQKKDRRDADEVTQIMIQECQALLRLFGLPYITAPMEAEAQCAELVRLGLVDGIVTDDSDCFLFGGTRVYKNMFNQAKFVECYLTSDMEKEFDLTRDRLISIAHLLGSDYTEGLPGIGPVTAMEILSEFRTLEDFKDWWTKVQMNEITKADDASNTFRKKFRKNASKVFLPTGFPDARVALAYQQPEVDGTPDAFQWGVPDLDALRSYLMATIGWSQERTDEVLVPVIKDMNRRVDEGTQANITSFFDGTVGIGGTGHTGRGEAFAPRRRVDGSKRMGSALHKMADRAKRSRNESTTKADQESTNVTEKPAPKSTSKGAKKRKTTQVVTSEASSGSGSEFERPRAKKSKRKPKAHK